MRDHAGSTPCAYTPPPILPPSLPLARRSCNTSLLTGGPATWRWSLETPASHSRSSVRCLAHCFALTITAPGRKAELGNLPTYLLTYSLTHFTYLPRLEGGAGADRHVRGLMALDLKQPRRLQLICNTSHEPARPPLCRLLVGRGRVCARGVPHLLRSACICGAVSPHPIMRCTKPVR